MASSDYLAIKKRKYIQPYPNDRSSSSYLQNHQYYILTHTTQIDEDGDLVNASRFSVTLPSECDFSFLWNTRGVKGYVSLFSIPRIHVPEYIKKRYTPPFCWTCFTPYGEIMQEIACSVCDGLPKKSAELSASPSPPLFNLIRDKTINIDAIIEDFENSDLF